MLIFCIPSSSPSSLSLLFFSPSPPHPTSLSTLTDLTAVLSVVLDLKSLPVSSPLSTLLSEVLLSGVPAPSTSSKHQHIHVNHPSCVPSASLEKADAEVLRFSLRQGFALLHVPPSVFGKLTHNCEIPRDPSPPFPIFPQPGSHRAAPERFLLPNRTFHFFDFFLLLVLCV